jgi:hypothetical protein
MDNPREPGYQEGGLRHPDAAQYDITKAGGPVPVPELTKITGWWNEESLMGLEIEYGSAAVSTKAMCVEGTRNDPPHCASLRLAQDEYFTEVAGLVSNKVDQISFRTSRGTLISFGIARAESTPFKLAQKNCKVTAVSVGVGERIYFVGAYFALVSTSGPGVAKVESEEEQKASAAIPAPAPPSVSVSALFASYPKAITYTSPKAICLGEKKALENPETFGRFDDFEFVARGPLQENKKVRVREIMLYFTAVRRLVLGYKMKYEILEPDKPVGKIIEVKHVAANPLTPTLHAVKLLDEGETITQIRGKSNKATQQITYLAIVMSTGAVLEGGVQEGPDSPESVENFVLEGKDEKNIIALAGKVTDSLNALGIYCTK